VFGITDEGTDEHGDVEYDDDSFAACPSCGWEGEWWETETEVSHGRLLIKALKEHPEEALEIATRAVIGLLIVPGSTPSRVIKSTDEYDSACDYLEYVEQSIMDQPNLYKTVMRLQEQSEAEADEEDDDE
jgi:hypothetical protein